MKNNTVNQELQKVQSTNSILKMKEMVEVRDDLVQKRAKYVPEDMVDVYVEKMSSVTLEEIEKMTFAEILEFNKIDEESALLALPHFDKPEETFEYLKSMLVFFKKTDNFVEETDKMIEELKSITLEGNKAIKEILLDKGDKNIVHHLRDRLTEAVKKAKECKDVEGLSRTLTSLEAFEDSFTLNRLKDLYRQIGSDNIKEDAEKRAQELYDRYCKTNKELGLTYDIIRISDLELNYLPEEYHEMNNLFVFICMKYIGKLTKTRGAVKYDDGLFASQLSTNLYLLISDGLPDEEKEILLTNIKELLDIIR